MEDLHAHWNGKRPQLSLRAKVLAQPRKVLRWKDVRTVKFFIEFLEWSQDEVYERLPKEERARRAALVLRLSKLLGYAAPCLEVRAWCLMAAARSLNGEYRLAAAALEIAERRGSGFECSSCRTAILRERVRWLLYHGRAEEAVECAATAVRYSMNDNDLGRSLMCHGNAVMKAGRPEEASQLYVKALTVLPPTEANFDFRRSTLWNWAWALTNSGKLMDAAGLLPQVRHAYKNVRGLSIERAHVRWLEGNICAGIGAANQAEGFLRRAFKNFAALQLPFESIGVAIHLTCLAYPDRRAVSVIMRALLRSEAAGSLPIEILKGIQSVYRAARERVAVEQVPRNDPAVAASGMIIALDWDPTEEIGLALRRLEKAMEKAGALPRLFDLAPKILPRARPANKSTGLPPIRF